MFSRAARHEKLYGVLPIRRKDDQGNLIAAGAEWIEDGDNSPWLIKAVKVCVGGLAVFAGFHFFGWAAALAILAAAAYFLTATERTDRAIIFELDGRIDAPAGIPADRRMRVVSGNHGHLTNIEPEHQFVTGFSASGRKVNLAKALDKEHAHTIAVQLNAALYAIRDAGADIGVDLPDVSGNKPLKTRKGKFQ